MCPSFNDEEAHIQLTKLGRGVFFCLVLIVDLEHVFTSRNYLIFIRMIGYSL